MTSNVNTKTHSFSHLQEHDKEVCLSLLETENKLSSRCNDVVNLDKKISEMSVRIEETDSVAKNRSLGTRVGYGFAGTAIALLCPISWSLGIILHVLFLFDTKNLLEKADKVLFLDPVKLCGELFTKAVRTKEDYAEELKKLQADQKDLLAGRVAAMTEINDLENDMKTQSEKISKISFENIQIEELPDVSSQVLSLKRKVDLLTKNIEQLKDKSESKIEI